MNNQQFESPFHIGEQKIQERLGVRENMERFGRMVIRDHMPEQHQQFYNQLPFILVGHTDHKGNSWASIMLGEPGFIHSSNERNLTINSPLIEGDPIAQTLAVDSQQGVNTPVGILGIELPTRRRNRLAGHVVQSNQQGFTLEVDQSFGNCPQYIQDRELIFLDEPEIGAVSHITLTHFDEDIRQLIEAADTFFIASSYNSGNSQASDGADVSHRGGQPGFVRVNGTRGLTIPDYMGNNHFNTFGNIEENGRAGLLFIDFNKGHIITLTGEAKIDWDSPEIEFFEGAQRLLQFELTEGRLIKNAIPARWSKPRFSPNSELTGTWERARKAQEIESKRNQWLEYQVVAITQESDSIRSFHLKPTSGQLFSFKPGQFLMIRLLIDGKELVRTYTVSSTKDDGVYRISVKRELSSEAGIPDGVASNFLHQQIEVGDTIEAQAPRGHFFFDPRKKKHALLVAAGIGITPMVAMLRQTIIEAIKTRYLRPITLVAIARNEKERAFYTEINQLVDQSQGKINVYWCLTQPEMALTGGRDFQMEGRPDRELYQNIITTKQTDAYLCGPSRFMQDTYDTLRSIGLSDYAIYAEAFGPSALQRDGAQSSAVFAKNAVVSVETDGTGNLIEQQWNNTNGSLLDFLESHGVQPNYGCRSGQCGICKAYLTSGEVAYFSPPGVELNSDEVLLCCAKPADSKANKLPKLGIRL